jgi:glycosyltransferase involved in cell wall biosynthesis
MAFETADQVGGVRVAIVNLTGGGLSGGYRKYLRKLLPLLQRDPRIELCNVFVPPQVISEFSSRSPIFSSWTRRDVILGFRHLARTLRTGRFDVVFIPTARWLNCGAVPVVSMVRNMEPLTVPFEGNGPVEATKNALRYWTARQAARKASRVLAVSYYVRDFILSQWGVDEARVGVVYHGSEVPIQDSAAIPTLRNVAAEPLLFTAGSIRPARGVEDLITALAELRKVGLFPEVVIAGSTAGHEQYRRKCEDLAVELGVRTQLRWAGPLSETEMSRYYASADAFVMTSRAEACPNIALEAMAHGCLCVSTDCPPMPEFFGKAALYYRARSAPSLGQVLAQVLQSSRDQWAPQRAEARRKAATFSWEACAKATVDNLCVAAQRSHLA